MNKSCSACFFSQLELMQGQIQRVLVCHHSPPSTFAVPAPQGGGLMAMTQFPVVQPTMFCHQFAPKAVDANTDDRVLMD